MEQQKMEEEARLQEQINEEVASLAVENEQKASDQQSAADMENQGNALLADKMYEEAITFYQTAQSLYKSLGMEDLAERIGQKITAAQAGMEADEEYAARKESEEKAEKREAAREAIFDVLSVFDVAPVDGDACSMALNTTMSDYEDAVLAVCAAREGADYIATGDKGFAKADSPVQVRTPAEILHLIDAAESEE